jgi:GT2 family glycosyltransferase
LGFAQANNQGCEVARGKYILLLNNDTLVEPDFLSKLVSRIEKDSSLGVIQPKIYMMDKPGYLDNCGSFLTRIGFLSHWGFGEKDGKEFNSEREIFSAKGACMLIRREVIEKVGLFDPDFVSYFEESDFCWRVWLGGWKVLFYPETSICHKIGFTIRRLDVVNLNFHYYKNRISSLTKNLGTFNLLTILPLHLAISFGIFISMLLRGRAKESLIIVKAILWNVIFLPKLLKKRAWVQKMRKLGDRELFKKILLPVNWSKFYGDFKRVETDLRRGKHMALQTSK